ncbi:tetratricopeptide repeat protein [[Clostridium] polysaccharolyticum]|uniref:Tetratricopeptide repeat-containing protein n=1 Tax=[Clostridium] polysaccharolyticum TaxID=29364 RepID=A0A1H9Y7X1_9FIRM|nr:tetratricopeptide repeat protein [[Clostridium] polysaccharolyticum]SES64513.1 Tetratricopeptide repeat-containing protein [[Clostridium] polysaccharolyticum]
MHCPKCNSDLSFKQKKCDRCGEDLTTYRKIVSGSNRFYNDGLMRARVRDLSGAAVSLKKSLELDKTNTNARNLLGLVYYEMGETVDALSQWVISKHFQPVKNEADVYVKDLQQNPAALEAANQMIKKYNQALNAARQGNEDLAIIQLKKVTSLNSKFLRAQQLLALLYLKQGDNEKAYKCLKKVLKIDINNTTSIRYMNEVKRLKPEREVKELKEERTVERVNPKSVGSFSSVDKFQDDKPNIWLFINLILGAVVGVAFAYFLIVPTVKKSVASEYKNQIQKQEDFASSKDTAIDSLKKEIEALNGKLGDKDQDIQKLKDQMVDETVYDNLFEAITLYQQGKRTDAAEVLVTVNEKNLTSTKAKEYYNTIKEATFVNASRQIYNQAKIKYNYGNYTEAKPLFEKAIKLDNENIDAYYFLARAYEKSQDVKNAKKYYNKVISDFAGSSRAREAQEKLKYMGE